MSERHHDFGRLLGTSLSEPTLDADLGEETPAPSKAWMIGSVTAVVLGVAILGGSLVLGSATAPRTAPGAGKAQMSASPAPHIPRPSASMTPALGVKGVSEHADRQWVKTLAAKTGIPERALAAYAGASLQSAAEYPGCGLGWNTLAGIGHVESEHGTINGSQLDATGNAIPAIIGIALTGHTTQSIPDTDQGSLDGDPVWDRAVGPMQFIPTTWNEWGADGNNDGIKDPQNIDDSTLAAARYLCHVGVDLTQPERWIGAIAAYNDTVEYNNRVAESAAYYAGLG